jgi:hypothetical protein
MDERKHLPTYIYNLQHLHYALRQNRRFIILKLRKVATNLGYLHNFATTQVLNKYKSKSGSNREGVVLSNLIIIVCAPLLPYGTTLEAPEAALDGRKEERKRRPWRIGEAINQSPPHNTFRIPCVRAYFFIQPAAFRSRRAQSFFCFYTTVSSFTNSIQQLSHHAIVPLFPAAGSRCPLLLLLLLVGLGSLTNFVCCY